VASRLLTFVNVPDSIIERAVSTIRALMRGGSRMSVGRARGEIDRAIMEASVELCNTVESALLKHKMKPKLRRMSS